MSSIKVSGPADPVPVFRPLLTGLRTNGSLLADLRRRRVEVTHERPPLATQISLLPARGHFRRSGRTGTRYTPPLDPDSGLGPVSEN